VDHWAYPDSPLLLRALIRQPLCGHRFSRGFVLQVSNLLKILHLATALPSIRRKPGLSQLPMGACSGRTCGALANPASDAPDAGFLLFCTSATPTPCRPSPRRCLRRRMSALPSEADITEAREHVCFGPVPDSCTAANRHDSLAIAEQVDAYRGWDRGST